VRTSFGASESKCMSSTQAPWIAPAVASAIFAATGRRLHALPFRVAS
jgi:CO/xanthine dehydrogenase Mo-binding subunit